MKNIVTRLTEQLIGKGMLPPRAKALAHKKMLEAGNIASGGALTKKGEERSALGAAGRAKDRAAKDSGRKPSDYKYNQLTNRARLK